MMKNSLLWCIFATTAVCCFANNSTDIPECTSNDDCATDRVCAKQQCVDPCAGVCGPHTVCHVVNHVAMCSCSPGHSGHPTLGCSATRVDVIGQSTCRGHDQCPNCKACIQGTCSDPCDGLCGDNTTCSVRLHVPACACRDGHMGNPFTGCAPQVLQRLSTGRSQGKKKFFIPSALNWVDWDEAFVTCIKERTRLATIETMEELHDAIKVIRQEKHPVKGYWTSGVGSVDDEKFIWASSGEQVPSSSNMWYTGHPDKRGAQEYCVMFWDSEEDGHYLFYNAKCTNDYSALCEYY